MAAIPALRVVTSCANLSEFVRVFRGRTGTDTLEVPGVPTPPPLDTVGRLVVTLANRVTILDGDAALVAAPNGGLTIRFTRLDVRSRGLLLHLFEVRDAATLGPVPRHLVPLGAPVGDPAAARDGAELAACAIEPLSARPADPAKRAMPVLPTLRGRPTTSPPPIGAPLPSGASPSIAASPQAPVPALPRVGPPIDAAPTPAKLAAAAYAPRPTVATRLPPPPTIPTVRTPVMQRPVSAPIEVPETIVEAPPSVEPAPSIEPAPSVEPAPSIESAPTVEPAPLPIPEAARLPGPPIAAPPPRVTATITAPAAPIMPAAPTLPAGAPPRPGDKARRRREEQATLIGVRAPRVIDADTDLQRAAVPAASPPPPPVIDADTDPQRAAAPPRLPIIEHEYTLHGPAPVRTTGPGLGDFTSPDLGRGIPDDSLSGVTLRGIAVPSEVDTGETEANHHGHDDLATDVAFALPDDPGDDLDPLVDPPAPLHQAPRGIALAVSRASATPRPVTRTENAPTGADVAVTAPMSTAPQHDPFDEPPVTPAPSSSSPPTVVPSGTAPVPIPQPGAWAMPSWSPVPGVASMPAAPPPVAPPAPPAPIAAPPPSIAAPSPPEPVPSMQITPPPVAAPSPLAMHGTTPLPMMAPAYAPQPYPPPSYAPPPAAPPLAYAPPPAAPAYVPPPAPPSYPTAQLRALDYPPPPSGASQGWRRRVEVSDEGTDMTEIISVPRPPRRRRWPVIVITTAVIVVLTIVGIIVASSSSGSSDDAEAPPSPKTPPPGSSAAPAAPAAPTAPAAPAAAAAATAAPPAPEAPPAVADGTATTCRAMFTSVPPGATVVVAGTPLGPTPLTVDVACAASAAAFKRDRYQTRTLALSLQPGPAPTEVHARLERPTFTVTLTSRPAGAKITVAGRAAGTTPAKIQVPAYDGALVDLALPGYRPERQRVAPTRNNQRVELRLRRK